MKIDFAALQSASVTPIVHDTATKSADGMFYGRVALMADMLQEVANGTWVPSGEYAIRAEIKLEPSAITFNLANWAQDIAETIEELQCRLENYSGTNATTEYYQGRLEKLNAQQNRCGFTACAVGHACYDARFNAAGLVMSNDQAPIDLNSPDIHYSWSAVERFFGVSTAIAEWLFQEDEYPLSQRNDPAAVSQRCKQLVEQGRFNTQLMLDQR